MKSKKELLEDELIELKKLNEDELIELKKLSKRMGIKDIVKAKRKELLKMKYRGFMGVMRFFKK